MSIRTEICPLCGEGSLHDVSWDRAIEHKGISGQVRTKASECDACGCTQASPSQVRDNQRAMTAFQKKAEGRLTGKQMRTARNELKLTQLQASLVFGGGSNSFAKYEADDVTQSEAMDNLIRLALEVPAARNWLYAKSSVKNFKSATYQIFAEQTYHVNLVYENIASQTSGIDHSVLTIAGNPAQTQNPRYLLMKLQNHRIEGRVNQANWFGLEDEVDSKVSLYGEEENIQALLSPKYSEEDYDRHTQRQG